MFSDSAFCKLPWLAFSERHTDLSKRKICLLVIFSEELAAVTPGLTLSKRKIYRFISFVHVVLKKALLLYSLRTAFPIAAFVFTRAGYSLPYMLLIVDFEPVYTCIYNKHTESRGPATVFMTIISKISHLDNW